MPKTQEISQDRKTDYETAARSISLNLREFCNEWMPYPDMIQDAARNAAEEIARLREIETPDWMVVSAIRYALGRQTYIVVEATRWLIRNWPKLSLFNKKLIHGDVEEAFIQDDKDRAQGRHFTYYLGQDQDRASWQSVRDLWANGLNK